MKSKKNIREKNELWAKVFPLYQKIEYFEKRLKHFNELLNTKEIGVTLWSDKGAITETEGIFTQKVIRHSIMKERSRAIDQLYIVNSKIKVRSDNNKNKA